MQLELAIRGDLKAWSRDLATAVESSSRKALRITTLGLRKALRSNIRRAGFRKPGLSKALAAKVTKEEGHIYSVARFMPGPTRAAPVDLIALFEQGTTIRAASGQWLAIPTGEGPRRQGRGGMRFATPKEMVQQGWKTAVIPARHGGNLVVIATIAGAHYVTHVLVKQTTLRPRYNLDATVRQWEHKMPLILAGELNKAAEAKGV